MSTNSTISHLSCSECQAHFDHLELQTFCPTCTKPLLVNYDLEKASSRLSKSALFQRAPDMWRYRELLPVLQQRNIVSFGEGLTPLIRVDKVAAKIGLSDVWVKDEGQIPTGSFKARGLAMAVSKALELGVRELAIPTAGNAGGALAAYGVKAGMTCHIFMPKDVPQINYMEAKLTGANVTLVEGLISDCGKMVAEKKDEMGWFDVSTLKEPYRLEGKKTMGLELAEQFDWRLPDVVIYPTGGGTGLIGMWKAFGELREMGWLIGDFPRMISVQSEGCDPITRAFEAGKFVSEFFDNAQTVAAGLRVPKAFGDTLILEALQASGGKAVSVPDEEILNSMTELARGEGLIVCPEGAATWSALKKLRDAGDIDPNDRVVLFNTGLGLKYPEVLAQLTKNEA
ncbi:MAG: threonine synthase [Calditrichaeota bacterium]|nr:threonine synthase [Calditrichota bacterium]